MYLWHTWHRKMFWVWFWMGHERWMMLKRPFHGYYHLINLCNQLLNRPDRFCWAFLWIILINLLDHDWSVLNFAFTSNVKSRNTSRFNKSFRFFLMACLGSWTFTIFKNSFHWTRTIWLSWISKLWYDFKVIWVPIWISNRKHLDFNLIWTIFPRCLILNLPKTTRIWGRYWKFSVQIYLLKVL